MKRSPMPPRTSPLRSSGRPQRKRRDPKKFARIYGSEARAQWIALSPCVGCGRVPTVEVPNVNAHTESGHGTGYKADAETIAPLCPDTIAGPGCHTKYDQHQPPFDQAERREAVKLHAVFLDERWKYLNREAQS